MAVSARRQAQLAVIQAAREVVACWTSSMTGYFAAQDGLIAAVKALEALEPTPFHDGPGATPLAASYTSREAARRSGRVQGEARKAAYDAICATAALSPSMHGLTCDEIEVQLARPHTTMSSAVNWLLEAGWIEDSGHTRLTRAKRQAIVWRPTRRL